jgi:hypothetical protein
MGNIALFLTDEKWTDYDYYSDNLVEVVYILSTLLDLFLIYLIASYADMIQSNVKQIEKTILILTSISIFLIWYEAIYRTFWYYWGFYSNQGKLFDVNNLGIVGSLVLCIYAIFMIRIDKTNSRG